MIAYHFAIPLFATTLTGLVNCAPQQADQGTGLKKAVFGSTYDEIVVETQLAVRPKSLGTGSRTGRAKAVFFRPLGAGVNSSGAEVRRVSPSTALVTLTSSSTASTTPPTTPSDGLSYAARVVGVENPMARSKRVRRQWGWGSGSPWSGSGFSPSSSGLFGDAFGASSSQSGSHSFQVGPTGFSGSAGASGSQSYNLPWGDKISISFSNGFQVGPEGPGGSNSLSFTYTDPAGKKKTQNLFG